VVEFRRCLPALLDIKTMADFEKQNNKKIHSRIEGFYGFLDFILKFIQ
jgi:hypothetical protein